MPLPDEKLPGLTEAELGVLKKVFSSPLDIPAEWKAWLVAYLEANPPDLPINQSIGFVNLVSSAIDNANAAAAAAQAAADAAAATIFHPEIATTAGVTGTGGDASTPGPSITGLATGVYVVMAGADMASDFGAVNLAMTLSPVTLVVNGGGTPTPISASKSTKWTNATPNATLSSSLDNSNNIGNAFHILDPWIIAHKISA